MSQRYPSILEFAQLGLLNAVALLGGGALGWGLDSLLGTLPIFLFVGLLVGAGSGARYTWGRIKTYLAEPPGPSPEPPALP